MAAVCMSAVARPQVSGFSASKSSFKGTRVASSAPVKVTGGRASLQVRRAPGRPSAHNALGDRGHWPLYAAPSSGGSNAARGGGVV